MITVSLLCQETSKFTNLIRLIDNIPTLHSNGTSILVLNIENVEYM